jgi:hypothetical protein
MPDLDLTQLTHAPIEMRVGRGRHRQELRRRLAAVDPELRRVRNIETLRLAQLRHQLRMADTRRHPPAELQSAIEKCSQRLSQLDQQSSS